MSIGLGLIAIAAELWADYQAATAAALTAEQAENRAAGKADDSVDSVESHIRLSEIAGATGLATAVLAAIAWSVSLTLREPGLQSIPLLLLVTYGLLFLLLV